METILSYLDNMFSHMPKTPEVLRAKKELGAMMEDKYNQLVSEGKKENEAVGIVISEFGNLEEVAESLGLKSQTEEGMETKSETCVKTVNMEEAEAYLETSKNTIKWIALGVALCICSPTMLFFWGGLESKVSDTAIVCFGLIPLFIMVGIAVALFIYNGTKMERFEYLEKEPIWIDSALEKKLRQMEIEENPAATVKLIVGIMLCIFSVIPLLILGSITNSDFMGSIAMIFLLFCVAVGVFFIIVGTNRRECIKKLLQEGDYTKKNKKAGKLIDVVAGIYWTVMVAVYLGWSFYTMQWGITWIIWPVAGVLFGAIAVICKAVSQSAE